MPVDDRENAGSHNAARGPHTEQEVIPQTGDVGAVETHGGATSLGTTPIGLGSVGPVQQHQQATELILGESHTDVADGEREASGRVERSGRSAQTEVMTAPQAAAWQRLVQRVAASPPGAWVFARTLSPIDRFLYRRSGGRLSVPGTLAGLPVALLTTRGARSGVRRTVPVLALRDGERLVLLASNWGQAHHPAWYTNLRANPEAMVTLGRRRRRYQAREATDEERARYWTEAVRVYPGYAAYQTRTRGRRIPILVLTPTLPQHNRELRRP